MLNLSDFVPKKCIIGEIYCTALCKRNLQLKHIEFLLRITATILCRRQRAEIGLDASKIMIFMLKIKKKKNALAHHRKKFQDKKIGGIIACKLMSGASWTWRIIRSWSQNSSGTFESIRSDWKARARDAVQVEAKRRRMASWHVWTAASMAEK